MHAIVPSTTPENGNFAELVLRHGRLQPWVTALLWANPDKSVQTLDFGTLNHAIGCFRHWIRQQGWSPDDRIVVIHPPGPDLYIAVLALLAEGLIPVFIDIGMGWHKGLQALDDSRASAVLAPSQLCAAGRLVDRFARPWRPMPTRHNLPFTGVSAPCVPRSIDDHGLISYTSGTTGRPKGADRSHASLIAQHQAIRADWPDRSDDIDMTCLPVLVLHNLCCGMPSVLPDMDFSAPAQAPGDLILEQITRQGVTRLSGASAFLERLADAALATGGCTRVRAIRIGGAPVNAKLARKLLHAFPRADICVVYGSTEAEPIAHGPATLLLDTPGPGYPVGYPSPLARIALLPPQSRPQSEAELLACALPRSEWGEVWVCGQHVLKGYVDNPEATAANKVPGVNGQTWHRTGDLAWQRDDGLLFLLGRTQDCLHSGDGLRPVYPVERTLDEQPGIRRSALIQPRPTDSPELFIEPEKGVSPAAARCTAMRVLVAHDLPGLKVHVLPALPVDSRHNSKIHRPTLKKRKRSWLRMG